MADQKLNADIHVAPSANKLKDTLLSEECLAFLSELSRNFLAERNELLERRRISQERIDEGILPDFPKETASIRNGDWRADPFPAYLNDRRVEITGPSSDAKMVINAFNSGANVYMSDFEDAQSPYWELLLKGQENLYRAVRRELEYTSEEGKIYRMNEKTAILFVRPRGLHLDEMHVKVDGVPIPGAFFDFGVFLFNNAGEQLSQSLIPTFYIPKTESYPEAGLWNRIFSFSEKYMGLKPGTIKATFLIETLPAAFQMDEILHEVREHSLGLNCGRWDYIFSYIKKLGSHRYFVLPDRGTVTMDKGFLLAYSNLLIKTCHRRGVHAMGGMSAYIPVKGNEEENRLAMGKVREDKEREVKNGHDGTWVAHPGLVSVAGEAFDMHMHASNQISMKKDIVITKEDLIAPVKGKITENGVRANVRVGIRYLEAWIGGKGAVPLYNLMEDAATSEISRAQLWQWIRHGESTDSGIKIDRDFVKKVISEESGKLERNLDLDTAVRIFGDLVLNEKFSEFLTIPAYGEILKREGFL